MSDMTRDLAQECADYATSLRSAFNVSRLEGREPKSSLRAAELMERAATALAGRSFSAPAVAGPGMALIAADELEELRQSLDFYQLRVQLLEKWQSKMRDPERTIVCDIVANGQTLPDADGTRYGRGDPAVEAPAVEPEADPPSVMRWLDEHCKKVAWSIESATFEITDDQAFALVTSFLSPPTDAAPQPAQEGEGK